MAKNPAHKVNAVPAHLLKENFTDEELKSATEKYGVVRLTQEEKDEAKLREIEAEEREEELKKTEYKRKRADKFAERLPQNVQNDALWQAVKFIVDTMGVAPPAAVAAALEQIDTIRAENPAPAEPAK